MILFFVDGQISIFVRLENTASCVNARRHSVSRYLCLIACVVVL